MRTVYGPPAPWFRSVWPWITLAAALIPVHGVFTSTRIFHVRDLSLFFWPRHLWLRETVAAGHLPLWDPYPAMGQAAFADPLHQLFFVPAMLLRLLPPEIIGFNLWVALPLPVGALGAYLLFRGRFSGAASTLGALVFTYAGPVVSTLLYPNLSWSVALMPWVVWTGGLAVDATRRRTVVAFAGAVALQALAGEPVTFAATIVLTVAFAATQGATPFAQRAARMMAGIAGGVLVAAVQLVPLMMATLGSARAQMRGDAGWSLHPLASLELLLPHIFGNAYDAQLSELPWLQALNNGRDPLFYSVYFGIGALTLILAAAASADRRWMRFWGWAIVIGIIAALGEFSIPYRMLQALVPPLETFRFPVKYLTICALAAGALAASGWTALRDSNRARALERTRAVVAVAGIASIALLGAIVLMADWSLAPLARLAQWLAIEDPNAAAMIRASVPSTLLRLALLGACGAGLLGLAGSSHRRRDVAIAALFGLAVVDPAIVHMGLNPTMPASSLREPAWVQATRAAGAGRVYVGARISDPEDLSVAVDGPRHLYLPAALSAVDARTVTHFQYAITPSAWQMHEVVSYDLPMLWSLEYADTLRMLSVADARSRWRFLARAGVRYCLVRNPFNSEAPVLMQLPDFDSFALYECNRDASRVSVTDTAVVEPDARERVARLFDANFAEDALMLAEPAPPAAGRTRHPRPAVASIVEETANRIVVDAQTGAEGGYLTLRDTFDPDWRVTVDGEHAPMLRGNVLFRSVRLAPGEHRVEFRYTPVTLYAGASISLFGLAALAVPWRRRRTADASGFTLIELLIVVAIIAIIAAIAIPGLMRSRQTANEASAIGSMRAIVAAEVTYAAACGGGGYAQSLADLALPPPSGTPFLGPDVSGGSHSGYSFSVASETGAAVVIASSATCNGSADDSVAAFHALGLPIEIGGTGQRSFASDNRAAIYEAMDGSAIANPIPAGARMIQ